MKAKPVGEFLTLLILMCAGLLLIIRYSKYGHEGFADNSEEQASYQALRPYLKNMMAPYCEIANLVQEEMMKTYMTSKVETPLPTPPPKPIAEPKTVEGSEVTSKSSEKKGRCEIFNIGTGTGHSVLEIVSRFEQVTGKKVNYEFAEGRKGDVVSAYADCSKALSILGWKAKRSLDDSLLSSWNWQKNLSAK